jgi:hypothetical protein
MPKFTWLAEFQRMRPAVVLDPGLRRDDGDIQPLVSTILVFPLANFAPLREYQKPTTLSPGRKEE